MPPLPTRPLIVTDLKHIKSGTTAGGEAFTLWQVRATGLDGIPIDQNLRTFEELPTDVPITVLVDFFKSSRGYGDSYTLKLADAGTAGQTVAPPSPPPPVAPPQDMQAQLTELRDRLAAVEDEVRRLKAAPQQGRTTQVW